MDFSAGRETSFIVGGVTALKRRQISSQSRKVEAGFPWDAVWPQTLPGAAVSLPQLEAAEERIPRLLREQAAF